MRCPVPRKPVDHKLQLKAVAVTFADGKKSDGCAEGNNAAWMCQCGALLVGRCYYQFGDTCHTECTSCSRVFRVTADAKKRATGVVEAP